MLSVPRRTKSNIEPTSCDPNMLIGNVTGKGKGIWKIIAVQGAISDMHNYFFASFFQFFQ